MIAIIFMPPPQGGAGHIVFGRSVTLSVCLWLCPHFCRLFPNPPGNTRTFQKCQIFPDPPGNTRTLCFGSPFSGMGFCLLFPNFWVFDGSGDHFRETSKFVENSWGVYICVRGKFSPRKGAAIERIALNRGLSSVRRRSKNHSYLRL